ncbi:MAG: hypothetical protein D6762_04730 [Candidatus Neomarinimicrobiota bacterium]|nr:MAG: hypothetical protein D6762_04730 [Candidatus Neomarinimicrobiota bacterium]
MKRAAIFLSLILAGSLWAQERMEIKVDGKITYITTDQVYCDVGTDAGVGEGDTLRITRGTEEVGLAVVTYLSRKSCVCEPLVPAETLQLGDRVHLEKVKLVTIEEVPETPATVTTAKPVNKKFGLSQLGNLSYRYTYSQFSDSLFHHRSIASLQYGLHMTRPINTQLWIYGRSNIQNHDFILYQARWELGTSESRFHTQIGRVYSSAMAGVGATDGILLETSLSERISAGLLGGLEPDPATLKFNSSVTKGGVFTSYRFRRDQRSLEGSLALVGQYASGNVDREFLYNRFRWRRGRLLYFTMNQTVDFYRNGAVGGRKGATLVSNQLSLRIRPLNWLSIQSRISSRKQVLYQQSSRSFPDSLFVDETRSGWYNAVYFNTSGGRSYRLGANYRFQSTGGGNSIYAFLGYRGPYRREGWNFDYTGSFLHNLLITGSRNQFGFTRKVGRRGSLFAEYELYVYGYGNKLADYIQHNVTATYSWQYRSHLVVSTSLDATVDKDYKYYYLYFAFHYRF